MLSFIDFSAISGNWGSWSTSLCSVTCGSGIQSRVRKCDNPPPQNGGKACEGKSREVVRCNTQECPTTGRKYYGSCIYISFQSMEKIIDHIP